MLKDRKVGLVICGNLDFNAETALYRAGMEVIRDVEGNVCNVLRAWQMGYLEPETRPACENATLESLNPMALKLR
jgi:predicted Fe-Mo cluster-binding NifX family protein